VFKPDPAEDGNLLLGSGISRAGSTALTTRQGAGALADSAEPGSLLRACVCGGRRDRTRPKLDPAPCK
jgi:hypothetical protein